MVDHDQILRIVKSKGPIIPLHIMREIGSDTITIAAMLAELVDAKKVKISNSKIGSSPNYYVAGQASKLQKLVKYMNDKDQKAFEIIKEKRVVRDISQEPVIRVALRAIKDFAKPLEVRTKNGIEIYWKWYLLKDKEAEKLIKKDLKVSRPKRKTTQTKLTKSRRKTVKKTTRTISKDKFLDEVKSFFENNRITIASENVVRKGTEVDFVVRVPSPLGRQEYFCKAKSKQKCNDGDLGSAYLQGQVKKLPVIFITTGEITNKARDMLSREFKGMIVKKI